MKDVRMIDDQIDVMLWLYNSLKLEKDWPERDGFFKQFNDSFVKKYKILGKHKFFKAKEVQKSQKKTLRGSYFVSAKSAIKLNTLLKALDSTQDHSYKNLNKLLQGTILENAPEVRINNYIFRLVDYGAIKLMGIKPRLYEVLLKSVKKSVD